MPRSKEQEQYASAREFKKLMDRYGIAGNDGADMVAKMIRKERITVQSYFSRGCERNLLELIEYKLKDLAGSLAK